MCLNFLQREVKHCVVRQRQDHVLQQVQHQHCGINKQNKIFNNFEAVVWTLKGVYPFQRFGYMYMKLESCVKTTKKIRREGDTKTCNSNVWDRIVLSAPVATVQTLSDGNKRGSLTIFLEDQEFKTAALISYMQLAFTADC